MRIAVPVFGPLLAGNAPFNASLGGGDSARSVSDRYRTAPLFSADFAARWPESVHGDVSDSRVCDGLGRSGAGRNPDCSDVCRRRDCAGWYGANAGIGCPIHEKAHFGCSKAIIQGFSAKSRSVFIA